MAKKLNTWMIVSIILGVLFICSIVYICAVKYKQSRDAEKLAIFQQGVQYGYITAVQELVNSSSGCKPVTVIVENKTTQFIDTSCLK